MTWLIWDCKHQVFTNICVLVKKHSSIPNQYPRWLDSLERLFVNFWIELFRHLTVSENRLSPFETLPLNYLWIHQFIPWKGIKFFNDKKIISILKEHVKVFVERFTNSFRIWHVHSTWFSFPHWLSFNVKYFGSKNRF